MNAGHVVSPMASCYTVVRCASPAAKAVWTRAHILTASVHVLCEHVSAGTLARWWGVVVTQPDFLEVLLTLVMNQAEAQTLVKAQAVNLGHVLAA